ncbi:MAG TPA: lectin like domain-containing protein [Armatimonadota bacterium]|jgi:C1A family cysteine protease
MPCSALRTVRRRSALRLLLLLPALLLALGVFAQAPQLAPVSANFSSSAFARSVTGFGAALGFRPAPVHYTHATGQRLALMSMAATALPATFDLRTQGRVTPVRNQNPLNTCWTFATYGSLESCLLPGETRDFSEIDLAKSSGFTLNVSDGGNEDMATAYLARWGGPINESDEPYTTSTAAPPSGLPVQKHLQDVAYLPDRSGPLDNASIKQAIMSAGALYTSMFWSDSAYKASTAAYYYSGLGMNHAVTLVGWDDNYSRTNFAATPPGDGAFLVRNSWGTSWGNGGYFYISYYDSVVGHYNALFYGVEPATNYARVYQYDPLGLCSNSGYGSPTARFANVFTAVGSESLAAASWYVASPGSSYQLSVYVNPTNGPLAAGSPVAQQTGLFDTPGYHTVKLMTPVALAAGQRFSVVVTLTTPGYNYPIPIERPISGYSDRATALAGQSYMSANGTSWTDVTQSYANTNVCLKAFTRAGSTTIPPPTTLTGVNLTTSIASPRTVATTIRLTATPIGSTNVEYQFQRYLGGAWATLRAFSTTAYVDWTPTVAGAYTVRVIARMVGSTAFVYRDLPYTITAPVVVVPLTGVRLSANPFSPSRRGTLITLTAIPSGGTNVEYKFLVKTTWLLTSLSGYGGATCAWQPSTAGSYTLVVYARVKGSTRAYDVVSTLPYTVQ